MRNAVLRGHAYSKGDNEQKIGQETVYGINVEFRASDHLSTHLTPCLKPPRVAISLFSFTKLGVVERFLFSRKKKSNSIYQKKK